MHKVSSNNHNHIPAPLSYCSCCPPMWPNHFPFLLCFAAHAAYFIFLFLFHFRKLSFLLISSFYHAKNTVAHLFLTSFSPISVVSMSGSAMLYGLLHCQNSRYIHPSKPCMITFDCKLYLGNDDESNVCIMMGVLHFFVPVNLPTPIDNRLLRFDYKSRRQTLWVTRVCQGSRFWVWMMPVGLILTQHRAQGQDLGFSPSASSRWGCLPQEVLTVDYRTCELRIDGALVTIQ